MNSDKKPNEEAQQGAPADALSKTPDELEDDKAARAAEDAELSSLDGEIPEKKLSPVKKFLRKVNVYLLFFVIILVTAGAIAAVSYLNSQKAPVQPTVESQPLTAEALKSLANSDASVGNSGQTLTIQGSAIINGQTLARGNLSVAGNLQTGGSIKGPTVTISGASNFGDTQVNTLQVANDVSIQGSATIRDINVSGVSSFNGAMTASQITVTQLILSGNASLEVPNHVSFTGATPSRTTNATVLGSGGSANIGGSDTAGTINVSSGNNPTAGCFITIKFNQAFSRLPHVIISPVGLAAGQLMYYTERDNNGFTVCTSNAPTANQAFAFDYFITF